MFGKDGQMHAYRHRALETNGYLVKANTAVQQLFGDTGTHIIGTRHGEKLFETLMTREERLRSEDMGKYFRVAADDRDLNYDKFVVKGEVHTMADESYTSHNTKSSGCRRYGEKDYDHRLCVQRAGDVGGRAQVNILVTGAKGMVGTAPCVIT